MSLIEKIENLMQKNEELKQLTNRQIHRTAKLTDQVDELLKEKRSLEQKLSECYKLFEKHIALLLRLSAFDAPEAKGLALALNTEVARIKSIGEQQELQECEDASGFIQFLVKNGIQVNVGAGIELSVSGDTGNIVDISCKKLQQEPQE